MTRSITGPSNPDTVHSSDGFVHRRLRWTGWIEERPFREVDDLREWVKRDIANRQAWHPDAAYREEWRRHFLHLQELVGDTVIVHTESGVGIDYAFHIAGLELFVYLCADDPGLVSEWLEAVFQSELRRTHCIADQELSPVVLTFGDIAYKGTTIFSPDFLRREFFLRLKLLNDAWHEHGIKCLFHSDGYLMEVMPDLIEAGIDGLNPIERLAGMDLNELKSLYGDRLFFAGGIDVSQLMAYGTPDQVRQACREAIETTAPGYFLGSTTELHNALPGANIIAMVESVRP
jgi:uroporphyrinogen decarboxylase